MKPIRILAGKSGSSKAVSYAKEILEKLDSTETEQIQSAKNTGLRENQGTIENTSQSKIISSVESPADFEKIWLSLPEGKELIEDHVTFRVKAIELRKKGKSFSIRLEFTGGF